MQLVSGLRLSNGNLALAVLSQLNLMLACPNTP